MNRITSFYFNTIVPKLKHASQFAEHLLTSIFNRATGKTFQTAYDKNPKTVKMIGFLGVTALCAKLLRSGGIDHLLGRSDRLKDLSIDDINGNIPLLQSFRERGLSPVEKRTLSSKMRDDVIEAATKYPNIFEYDLVLPAEDAGHGDTFQTLAENAVRQKQKDAVNNFYYFCDFHSKKLQPTRSQMHKSVSEFLPSLPAVLFEKGFLQRNNPDIVAFIKKFVAYCREYYIEMRELPQDYEKIAIYIDEHCPLPANLRADLRTARLKYSELAAKQRTLHATIEKLTNQYNATLAREAIETKHEEKYEKQKKAAWEKIRPSYEAAKSEIEKINATIEANSTKFETAINQAQF